MNSILNEIRNLRGEDELNIDFSNTDRYRVVINEENNTKTAYFFSSPIYRKDTLKAVALAFFKNGDKIHSQGSNATVKYGDSIFMENEYGWCRIFIKASPKKFEERQLVTGEHTFFPTTNGFACKTKLSNYSAVKFEIELSSSLEVKTNGKYFALMRTRFQPFLVASTIGTLSSEGEIVAPASISYERSSGSNRFRLCVTPDASKGEFVFFEINMHEDKLVQDTTVESKNPTSNNVFGGTAFVGSTPHYGEQWLYSRFDFLRNNNLYAKTIHKIILHLPTYNPYTPNLTAYKTQARFCSFGSNWNNRVPAAAPAERITRTQGYIDVNVTALFIDHRGRIFPDSCGLILRPMFLGHNFAVLSTADSMYAPQIYEIRYAEQAP